MAQIVINGNVMAETNDEITVTTYYEEGIKIADIVINGRSIPIYIPTDLSQIGGENS